MSRSEIDYWAECLVSSFDEHGIAATAEQVQAIARDVSSAHECYGMAFYSPPASDRISDIEREWKAKLDRLQREYDAYKGDAETAVKIALRQYPDSRVAIGPGGEVRKIDGRSDRIQ